MGYHDIYREWPGTRRNSTVGTLRTIDGTDANPNSRCGGAETFAPEPGMYQRSESRLQ
jgi:hypothetical protein